MTEHVHVWTHNGFDYEDGAECADPDCKAWLGTEEITHRLNATERFSGKAAKLMAEHDSVQYWFDNEIENLAAYAAALERPIIRLWHAARRRIGGKR